MAKHPVDVLIEAKAIAARTFSRRQRHCRNSRQWLPRPASPQRRRCRYWFKQKHGKTHQYPGDLRVCREEGPEGAVPKPI
jgi:hypothetical protein